MVDMSRVTSAIIGMHLRQLRKESGLTQRQVAERFNVPQSFVSKLEVGRRKISLYEMILYVQALDANPNEFVATIGKSMVDHIHEVKE